MATFNFKSFHSKISLMTRAKASFYLGTLESKVHWGPAGRNPNLQTCPMTSHTKTFIVKIHTMVEDAKRTLR